MFSNILKDYLELDASDDYWGNILQSLENNCKQNLITKHGTPKVSSQGRQVTQHESKTQCVQKDPELEQNKCNRVALAFPTFCTESERISGKSRNVKPRNLSLLCSLLAAAHNNYSVTLQLQLCSLKHVITLGSGVTQFTQ